MTRILTANTHARLALSKLEIVEQLILSHGISNEKQRYEKKRRDPASQYSSRLINIINRLIKFRLHNYLYSSNIRILFTSGMTCRILAEFGLSGLHHPAEPVRKMAEKILVLVYHSNPRLVRRQLPPDDDVTRRNILYRHLMQEFDRVDKEVGRCLNEKLLNAVMKNK